MLHPDRNEEVGAAADLRAAGPALTRARGCSQDTSRAFSDLCVAYTVLSSKQLRAVYDQYGETGLREGVPGSACASAGVSRCGG